ncbi:MAG: HlyC/CorC family transporter [Oscillospiraceae bacterium]|nr:HlyC/CorC family transporter [Oscillospiraceae bacterium]
MILFIASVIFNLSKSAAVYLDDSALHARAAGGDKKAARLEQLLSRHDRLKQSVNVFSALATTFAAILSVKLVLPLLLEYLSAWVVFWLTAFVSTVLFYSAAVYSPRRIAPYFPDCAYSLSGALKLLYSITLPLTMTVGAISAVAVSLCGKDPHVPPSMVTEEEIRMLVDEGTERGTIEESEMKMINNIFEFDDRDVSQVMTHRTELSAVEINATLEEVIEVAVGSGYSRIPVYEEDIDTICGILYAKDLIKYIHRPQEFRIKDNLREPICVPESSSCSDVFAMLQREKTQIAVVIDEYGGTYGIVTMEDLIESIVGSIQDEFDNEEEPATQIDEGVYILDGSTSISDAELLLDFYAPDDSEADTLGGFVIELLGGVPHEPEDNRTASYGNITFTVVRSDERRIEEIKAVIEPEE